MNIMKLETERLILRDFIQEDWQRVLEYQSDPMYLRYYDWTERTPEAVQEFVGWFLDHQQQDPRFKFQLAVTLKSNNLLIGNCGVRMDNVDAVVCGKAIDDIKIFPESIYIFLSGEARSNLRTTGNSRVFSLTLPFPRGRGEGEE